MTHDKLLLKIDECINWYEDQKDFEEVIPYMVALRSIVKLHKPYDNSGDIDGSDLRCSECGQGFEYYPCPTIQAIEAESVLEALGEDIE